MTIGDPGLAEQFMSLPNPGLQGGRPDLIITGATLGGTSAINGAVFSVPNLEVRATSTLSRCSATSSKCTAVFKAAEWKPIIFFISL